MNRVTPGSECDPYAAATFVTAQRAAAAAAATGGATSASIVSAEVINQRRLQRHQGSANFIHPPSPSTPGHGDCVLTVLLRWLTHKNRAATRNVQPPVGLYKCESSCDLKLESAWKSEKQSADAILDTSLTSQAYISTLEPQM
jgi:hypothetical protein